MILISRKEHLDFGYELFISSVSILSVLNMVLSNIPGVDPDSVNVLNIVNGVLTLLFIYDFFLRLLSAPSRSSYLLHNYGWADLLAIIPALRVFRVFRIYKAYRVIKRYGLQYIASYLSYNRSQSALYILVFMVILIIEVGAFLVLQAEHASPSANIITAGDAIWWAYVTITTTGYGDRYPVTAAGRMVGILVLTMGVAVFATFAGYISSKLLSSPEKEEVSDEGFEGEESPERCLREIKMLLREREELDTKISARLEKLEQSMGYGQEDQR